MGALTAKKSAFTYRSWENKSFQEIDETEVSLFRIRIEKLKNRRIRVLPIKYWISNDKRYRFEKQLTNTSIMSFQTISYYSVKGFLYLERFQLNYLSDALKVSFKILQRHLVKNALDIFLGRGLSINTFSRSPMSWNMYFHDLYNAIPSYTPLEPVVYNRFNLATSKVLLLTNPRYISPSFNSFLYQQADQLEIESFSSFSSSYSKLEIPFSYSSLLALNAAKTLLNDTTIVTSLTDITFNSTFKAPVINLYPLFLQSELSFDILPRNVNTVIDIDLSYGSKQFSNAFVSPLSNQLTNSSIYLSLINHTFDHYLMTKIDLKFLNRLAALVYLTLPLNSTYQTKNNVRYTPKQKKYLINGLLMNNL
jgi:hypothetical protein